MMILPATAALAALIYLTGYCHRPASWPKTLIKTVSVAILALSAWLGTGPVLLAVALTLCALGDYLLARDSEATFLAGVGAFAMGHLAYVALFLTTPGALIQNLSNSPYLYVIVLLCLYGAAMMALLFRKAGDLRFAVMGYVPVILSMGVAALAVPAVGPLVWVLPAAVLFMVSDSILASELFLLPETHPLRRVTPYAVWATYWLAQLGFFLAYSG